MALRARRGCDTTEMKATPCAKNNDRADENVNSKKYGGDKMSRKEAELIELMRQVKEKYPSTGPTRLCRLCGYEYTDPPATSRYGHGDISPNCGMIEALMMQSERTMEDEEYGENTV